MVVTVFRYRLNPGVEAEYYETAAELARLVAEVPGYVSHKSFLGEDGERVTVVEFESVDTLQQWRRHPEHIKAKKRAASHFYSEYRVQVCETISTHAWSMDRSRARV